ncbi:MAG TPA: type II toxin-antitoxin system VapC family toxin [Acetobacteraceae bacterium]|nr:type II toxin-antitoxin system VapC family toxin [Acetobacteraceae bacterium]
MQAWLAAQPPDDLAIGDWGITEFFSALSIKPRTGQIAAARRAAAPAQFARLRAQNVTTVPVVREQFLAAARLADRHEVGLRAGDALSLTVCADLGAVPCTLDRRLAEAAREIGVETEIPWPASRTAT